MRKVWIVLTITMGFTLAACSTDPSSDDFTITTTLFPHYDIVRALAPEGTNVELIVPAGVSTHDYEPSPQTVARILESDVFIYTGDFLEPWLDTILADAITQGVTPLEMADFVVLLEKSGDDHDADEDDHDHGDVDPHFWLDPTNMILMTNAIKRELIALNPDAATHIEEEAAHYIEELRHFDEFYGQLSRESTTTTMMHGGHNAFGYFARAYGFDFVNPYAGFSTDAEPTPGALLTMIDLMDTYQTQYLFSEALLASSVADTISEETGAEILYVYTMGQIGADDWAAGMTVFDMMEHNLEQFVIGLGYTGEPFEHDDHDDQDDHDDE